MSLDHIYYVAAGMRNDQARNDQAQANRQQTMNTFYRAFGACMEGRGYTVR